jgi:putative spermidine/putrescine transport system ATP-binding protein
MTAPFLSICGVCKRFGDVAAVDNISLDVDEGEFVTFLGPSGSGKSTALYMIAGFEDPSAGDILLRGASLVPVSPDKRGIGMVFQRYTLFPHLSVADNIGFPLRVRGCARAEITAKVADMLRLVRLEKFAHRMPHKLSGGQQQRVALARALAYDPPLLLMDEPLSALDKKLREEIQFEIKRIHNETGVTILYVTHDQEEALRLSDRVALFNHGAIEQVGSGRDLYERPATRFVADFIGNSSFLRATLERRDGACGRVEFPDGSGLDGVALVGEIAAGAGVAVMLRPDHVHLAPDAEGALGARVVATTYLGDCLHVVAATSWGQTIDARVPLGASDMRLPEVGERIALRCEPSRARAFAGGK